MLLNMFVVVKDYDTVHGVCDSNSSRL